MRSRISVVVLPAKSSLPPSEASADEAALGVALTTQAAP
jgi:hypothetical protein